VPRRTWERGATRQAAAGPRAVPAAAAAPGHPQQLLPPLAPTPQPAGTTTQEQPPPLRQERGSGVRAPHRRRHGRHRHCCCSPHPHLLPAQAMLQGRRRHSQLLPQLADEALALLPNDLVPRLLDGAGPAAAVARATSLLLRPCCASLRHSPQGSFRRCASCLRAAGTPPGRAQQGGARGLHRQTTTQHRPAPAAATSRSHHESNETPRACPCLGASAPGGASGSTFRILRGTFPEGRIRACRAAGAQEALPLRSNHSGTREEQCRGRARAREVPQPRVLRAGPPTLRGAPIPEETAVRCDTPRYARTPLTSRVK
jgi:hypothetical protein